MIRFQCECGAPLYFENTACLACKSEVGFDPIHYRFKRLNQETKTQRPNTDQLCANGLNHGVCNWIAKTNFPGALCFACQFNRFIPNLNKPRNLKRWSILEAGKKRLLFNLLRMGIPLFNIFKSSTHRLTFDFLENLENEENEVYEQINTGYLDGVITINVLEAEPIARAQQQESTKEAYRTVLGHMRHESGHYIWSLIKEEKDLQDQFQDLFGNHETDYGTALTTFYQNGAVASWSEHHITPYASSHPIEDWAETWGHYLHISDAVETAVNFSLIPQDKEHLAVEEVLTIWQNLFPNLNEMNRSMGLDDLYPFTLNESVIKKLSFADAVKLRLQNHPVSGQRNEPNPKFKAQVTSTA